MSKREESFFWQELSTHIDVKLLTSSANDLQANRQTDWVILALAQGFCCCLNDPQDNRVALLCYMQPSEHSPTHHTPFCATYRFLPQHLPPRPPAYQQLLAKFTLFNQELQEPGKATKGLCKKIADGVAVPLIWGIKVGLMLGCYTSRK